MPSRLAPCIMGIDVGGTNTDAVILQDKQVLAWHKTPTTSDIQASVERAIQGVLKKANIPPGQVQSVKIGTTQFVNAVLEENASKLDKVAVIRLCGPYSRGSPPFSDFPPLLRSLIEGHFGYVDGGYQVDGPPLADLNHGQLREQASIIRAMGIKSVVLIGIYSPSNPKQELEAQEVLASEFGAGYDITCSHAVGRLSLIERENASILNASLRRFARHVIAGLRLAVSKLGTGNLYITLNDGTLSTASTAAEYPVRCFSSGPTNSARGAALLAQRYGGRYKDDDAEVLVVDVGGTTTDICALLKSGYLRQSAAFVKIAGVRTNFTVPDVRSIALGGGSIIRQNHTGWTSVGPDSVGSALEKDSIAFGGKILTANDLVLSNKRTDALVSAEIREAGLREIQRAIEDAIDLVKTKQADAKVILVGGGSVIFGEKLAGVRQIIRPDYLEVANAVGAAIGKISGTIDTVVFPGPEGIDVEVDRVRKLAIERCVAAGGDIATIETVEIAIVPVSYTTNGAAQIALRVVGDLLDSHDEAVDTSDHSSLCGAFLAFQELTNSKVDQQDSKASSYQVLNPVNLELYRPRVEGNIWYLSELDLDFLMDGAGVLGVGSCGEPYPSYLACKIALRNGKDIKVMRQDTLADDAVVLAAGFMGSPSVYFERVPGLDEITQAMTAVMAATGLSSFDACIPTEIGGLNAFEALLAASRFNKCALDTDTVARAYPLVCQTVRCLNGGSVIPSAVSDGMGNQEIFYEARDNIEAEDKMRNACTKLGSLSGMCVSPLTGTEAKELPKNSYSHAWALGRNIALARTQKRDIAASLLQEEDGALIFTGKIIKVDREVGQGFTRGNVTLKQISSEGVPESTSSLFVEFENENLVAILRSVGKEEEVLAVCPDLIAFLDLANGAPLGVSDYKYGLRVSVIALRSPPMWCTERGLEVGGPRAFGLDVKYKPISSGEYKTPVSVFEMFAP